MAHLYPREKGKLLTVLSTGLNKQINTLNIPLPPPPKECRFFNWKVETWRSGGKPFNSKPKVLTGRFSCWVVLWAKTHSCVTMWCPFKWKSRCPWSWCLTGDEDGLGNSSHEEKGSIFLLGKKFYYFPQDSRPVCEDFCYKYIIFPENIVPAGYVHHFRAERPSGPFLNIPPNH